MAVKTASSYCEMLQRYADEFFQETGAESATTRDIALWAIEKGLWQPRPDLLVKKCQEDFARALREEYFKDKTGRPVRAMHVARISNGDKQLHLWADIRNASPKHMRLAFQQRREQIVGDCSQLKRDVDFYNEVHDDRPPIQLVFDFTDDLEEAEFATKFKPGQPR